MTDELKITFLCPNGHKLSGPASLQGKPGQCPHCGSKFTIPDYSQGEDSGAVGVADEVAGPPAPEDSQVGPGQETSAPIDPDTLAVADTTIAAVPPTMLVQHPPATSPELSSAATGLLSLRDAFEILWARRSTGAYVELHLKSGDILSPEFYSTSLSGPAQGLFATRDDDGCYALAAVAWDAVAQVSLRGVAQLPDDLFAD